MFQLSERLCADLTDGGVFLFTGPYEAIPCQFHGQTKIANHTRAIILHQNIAAV